MPEVVDELTRLCEQGDLARAESLALETYDLRDRPCVAGIIDAD